MQSKFVEEGGLQEVAVVLAIVEQPKDKLCVLAVVMRARARVYAALHDRARLGADGLELSGAAVSSGGGGGGGGGEVVHGAGVRRFAWFYEMNEKGYLQYNSDL